MFVVKIPELNNILKLFPSTEMQKLKNKTDYEIKRKCHTY